MTAAAASPVGKSMPVLSYKWLRLKYATSRLLTGYRLTTAERLLIAPQELQSGDPSIATAFYSGQVILAGKTVQTRGQSPFRMESPNAAWTRELHGFSWLRHFRDSDHHVVRHHARALVSDWLSLRELRSNPAVQLPAVAARRVLSWLNNAPLLLADADHATYHRFMQSLARDAKWLAFAGTSRKVGFARIYAAIALMSYTLCAMTPENDWQQASQLLASTLNDLILADGTPVTRNPADALQVAIDLLQVRTAFSARGRQPPQELQITLDRLLGFLRTMRHPDGNLALFNGAGDGQITLLGTVIAFGDTTSPPAPSAKFGGYHRLTQGKTTLLVDIGHTPPPLMAGSAHAGALSIELSDETERLIVNCGAGPESMDELREALRETAAHSVASLPAKSSLHFKPFMSADGSPRRNAIEHGKGASFDRSDEAETSALDMTHDGYAESEGYLYRRTLVLSANHLVGHDRFEGASRQPVPQPAVIRFHLHPRVQAMHDDRSVRLVLPSGNQWLFRADAGHISLEESIYFGGLSSQRRTQQIVVGFAADSPEGVAWTLEKVDQTN